MASQLNIKDEQTVRLVREYAAETGRTVTATVKIAIENDRRARLGVVDAKIARLHDILAAVRRDMPDEVRGMTTEEIGNSLYDDREPGRLCPVIVDTSVLIAILADEVEAAPFEKALTDAGAASISSGSWIEFSTVLIRKFGVADPERVLDAFRTAYGLIIVSIVEEHAKIAAAGYARYGRGTGHRARLNFGDCFAYALAKATGETLLFKGDGFSHADVVPAM